MPAYSDEQLVLRALDNSHPAFEQLVKQYQYRVLRTIMSIISNEQAAQDVAQETFLVAWSDLQKLKEKHKFGRWLNQIAINLSKLWLRDQRKHQRNVVFEEDTVLRVQELEYQSGKLRQQVWDAIDELAEDHREAVILHYISGYSYKEMGEMLSVPASTIRGRLQQARNQLRKEFLDMVTKLQLEIDSTVHKFLKERARQDGVSVEGLIIRLIERYKSDTDSPKMAVRKVWDNAYYNGGISPDGRYLSMVNWETFNLAVRDLTTGENRDITNDGKSGEGPHRCAGVSAWSPDGKQIAYGWYNEGYNELRIVGLDGSEPRVLWREEGELSGIAPRDWSQDGKFILGAVYEPASGVQVVLVAIVLVSVADGSVRILKSLEDRRRWNDKISLSPDGRYIAYARHVKERNELRDIFLLATDGSGREIPLIGHPDADDFNPIWAPDGKTVVFRSNHQDPIGTASLWLTKIVDGKQVGEPQFVMRSAGNVWPLGFTREGSLYYGIFCGDPRSDIYIASLDMETGEFLSQPTRLLSEGINFLPSWSPDGKKLAYLSRRASPEDMGFAGRTVLVIRSMETEEERELRPEILIDNTLRWSPDGGSLLCGGHYTIGIHVIDAQTGHVNTVVEGHRMGIWSPKWSTDGKTIFYIREITGAREWPCSIMAHNVASGEEKELYPDGSPWGWLVISPDGRELAFSDEAGKALKVIPTVGGEARELIRLHNEIDGIRERIDPVMWTSDGRHLLFEKAESPGGYESDQLLEVWRVSTEGGEPERLWEIKKPLKSLSWGPSFHPDGQRIAYSKGSDTPAQRELWVMENLLTTFADDK